MADMVGGKVVWNLDINDKKFKAAMSESSKDINSFAKNADTKLSGTSKKISSSFTKANKASKIFAGGLLTVGSALLGTAGLGIKTASEFEMLQTSLKTVTGSAELASEAMKTIKQVAKDSPFFEVGTLATFTQLMAASGQTIDEAVQSAIGFGDVAAAFGKGNAEMTRLGNTLSQVIGKGKADTVDFKELVNSGWVSVRKDVAESMGVSMSEFEAMISAGVIGYDEIAKASEKFAGSAEESSTNLSSLWQRLKETMSTIFADLVIDTGIFDAVKGGLEKLISILDKIDTKKIAGFIDVMKENFPIIAGAIAGGLAPAFIGLIPVLTTFAVAAWSAILPLLPWIALGAAIGFAIKLLISNFEAIKLAIISFAQTAITFLITVFEQIKVAFNAFITFITSIPEKIAMVFQAIVDFASQIPAKILEFFLALPEMIAFALGFVLATILFWGMSVLNYFQVNIPIWINSIITFFSELPSRLAAILMFVLFKVFEWGSAMIGYFSENIPIWIGNIVTWFAEIPGKVEEALSTLLQTVKDIFTNAYNGIIEIVSTWPGKLLEWGIKIAKSFVEGVKNGLNGLKDAFVNGFNSAKGAIQGNSPPKEGPLKNIDKWGFNVGTAWLDGMGKAISSAGSMLHSQLSSIDSQFSSRPAYAMSGGGSTQTQPSRDQQINVNIGQVNDKQDVDMITREIAYKISILPQ